MADINAPHGVLVGDRYRYFVYLTTGVLDLTKTNMRLVACIECGIKLGPGEAIRFTAKRFLAKQSGFVCRADARLLIVEGSTSGYYAVDGFGLLGPTAAENENRIAAWKLCGSLWREVNGRATALE